MVDVDEFAGADGGGDGWELLLYGRLLRLGLGDEWKDEEGEGQECWAHGARILLRRRTHWKSKS